MQREYYKTFEFIVRVPVSQFSKATRISRIRIDATDAHSAKCIVLGTYGNDALISNAMQVRK